MCSLDIPAGQAKLLGEPGMLQIPQAQGGPQASVPSSRLSHDGILSPTPNTRELALDVGWAAYLKPPFTLILELILPLIGPLNHIPGKGIFSLWAAYLLNADKENFGTTVTLFQHPKSISMLGLFVLGIRHRKIPEWDKHRTGNPHRRKQGKKKKREGRGQLMLVYVSVGLYPSLSITGGI